jgi:hypothetical protein
MTNTCQSLLEIIFVGLEHGTPLTVTQPPERLPEEGVMMTLFSITRFLSGSQSKFSFADSICYEVLDCNCLYTNKDLPNLSQ